MKAAVTLTVFVALISGPLFLGYLADVAGSEIAEREGREAFAAGVSELANPYVGARYYVSESRAWLRGWLYQKSKKEFHAPR